MPAGLYELLEHSARSALTLQAADGGMPPGHNGPYRDAETPVRNSAHWLITFLKVHAITGERRFRAAAERALAYLQIPGVRPMGAAYWCRTNPEKDFSNGLVGQAWVIEALAAAARALADADLSRLAADVFLLHPYDERRAAWRILNVDGSYGPPDLTFNHQLWFAAAASSIPEPPDPRVSQRVRGFMDRLERHLATYPDGLIRHRSTVFPAGAQPGRLIDLLKQVRDASAQRRLRPKSIGYHAFNLYGLALLQSAFPRHGFWTGRALARTVRYAASHAYRRALQHAPFGYDYNPSGIELAFALPVLQDGSSRTAVDWATEQFRRSYDFEAGMLSRGTVDPLTLAARIYEAARLPDMQLDLARGSPRAAKQPGSHD